MQEAKICARDKDMCKPTEKITAVMLRSKQKRLVLLLSQPRVAAKMSAVYNTLISIMCKKELNRSSDGVTIPIHTL